MGLRRTLTVLLGASLVLVACGGDGAKPLSDGNAGSGAFDPPPIQTRFPARVTRACDAASPTLDRIRREGTLFWAIGATPRFGFKLPDGRWAGVEAQNAAELATLLGVDYDITEFTYDVLARTLTTGQADIVGAQLFVTPERAKLIDFSENYYRAGQLLYVPRDSPYRTIEDLNDPSVRFVAGFGTAQLGLARKYLPRAQVAGERLTGQLILYEPIVAGRAQVTMTDASALQIIRNEFKRPPLAAIGLRGRIDGRVSADEMLDPFDVAFGLPKGDPAWKACVNAWVRDLLDSGRMQRRLDYWLAQHVS